MYLGDNSRRATDQFDLAGVANPTAFDILLEGGAEGEIVPFYVGAYSFLFMNFFSTR